MILEKKKRKKKFSRKDLSSVVLYMKETPVVSTCFSQLGSPFN